MKPLSDLYLLNKISEGDEKSFSLFFDRYYKKLFNVAFFFLRSHEMAEEAVSDVFVIIWNKASYISTVKDTKAYLYKIAKNQSLKYLKSTRILNQISIDKLYQLESVTNLETPELGMINEEYYHLIQKSIDSLPKKCKEIFRLYLDGELKQREIADLMNISVKTVEGHISRAYAKIKLYLDKEYNSNSTKNNLISILL